MRIVFMGTPRFSAKLLNNLILYDNIDVVCVYTRPDAIRGRGNKKVSSPVKEIAFKYGIPVETPSSLKDLCVQERLRSLSPDFICVAAYGLILPKSVLDIPNYTCLNVHGSLLPRWRGAAPVQRAILSGDIYTGISIMRMEEGMDTGDFCKCEFIKIDNKNAIDIMDEIADLGSRALVESVNEIVRGEETWVSQDFNFVTFANKLNKDELNISPSDNVCYAWRKVQASSLSCPCKCCIAGKNVTILRARVCDDLSFLGNSGKVIFINKRLYLCFNDGALLLQIVKPDGKKEMDALSFYSGLQNSVDRSFRWNKIVQN